MRMTVNVAGQVRQIKLGTNKALWPLFETVINSIQSFVMEKELYICGEKETLYGILTSIDRRKYYIEGSGQQGGTGPLKEKQNV